MIIASTIIGSILKATQIWNVNGVYIEDSERLGELHLIFRLLYHIRLQPTV